MAQVVLERRNFRRLAGIGIVEGTLERRVRSVVVRYVVVHVGSAPALLESGGAGAHAGERLAGAGAQQSAACGGERWHCE